MHDIKPPIVFLSPVIPAFTGNGLAMRAAWNIRALSERFTVHLLVVAIHGGQEGGPSEELMRHCAGWKRIRPRVRADAECGWHLRNLLHWGEGRLPAEWGAWTEESDREAADYFSATRCVRLWVFRFYLFPWARGWLARGGKAWLDLDESESGARRSQADLLLRTGESAQAERLRRHSDIYRRLERRYLGKFEWIATASRHEADRLVSGHGKLAVEPWPNVVALPEGGRPGGSRPDDGIRRLLFVGSFGHYPNREAVHFALREVMPRLQEMMTERVVLCVAGAGAEAHRAGFEGLPHLEWLGTVPDVGEVYGRTDLVLVPLHAGGGTRIKILEAFAHRKAVVSTRNGAEGLDVAHGRELWIADDPAEIAAACAELLRDPEKRERLAAAGHACASTRYSPEQLGALAAMLRQRLVIPPAE